MRKIGIKKLFVNSELYSDTIDNFLSTDNFLPTVNTLNINDGIRAICQNYWTKQGDSIVHAKSLISEDFYRAEQINDTTIKIFGKKNDFSVKKVNKKGILANFYNKNLWKKFVESSLFGTLNQSFNDHVFEIFDPIVLKEDNSNSLKENYINHEFVYNFFQNDFEYIINDINVDARLIPSAYHIANYKNKENISREENLSISLGGLIQENSFYSLKKSIENEENIKEYFKILAETINSEEAELVKSEIISYNQNYIINPEDSYNLSKLSHVPFPFFLKINFTNLANQENNFCHGIEKIGKIKQDLSNFLIQRNLLEDAFKENIYLVSEKNNFTGEGITSEDFLSWINSGLENEFFSATTNKGFSSERPLETSVISEYASLISYTLKNLKSYKRSYDELLKKPAHTEILFYKIEKRQFNYNKQSPIQTFFISPTKNEIINFIDTQIKYATKYYYTIKAVILVVGNKYQYSLYDYTNNALDLNQDLENCCYKLNIKNEADYKIFEIPLTRFSGAVHETPLVKPSVIFQKNDNFLQISFVDSPGETKEEFNILENKDFEIIQTLKDSQDNETKDQIISKTYENSKKIVEIYKITTLPVNYLSFQGKIYKTIDLENKNIFIDTLLPNVKYYYLFRYLNNHKTPSNTSKVYEVEMKDEDGYRYLETKEIDLHATQEKSLNKNMKRFLLIRPSLLQTRLNVSDGSKIENVTLGPNSDRIWEKNKNFILRIKSKKSNRIIDFNIKSIITRQKE